MAITKIAIAGIGGRMGRSIVSACLADSGVALVGGCVEPQDPLDGQKASTVFATAPLKFEITSEMEKAVAAADVLIDFTVPEATLKSIEICQKMGKAIIIGTTGFSPAQEAHIHAAGVEAPILKSGNMSLGVNLLAALVEQVAARLSADYDIEVFEAHHRHKVDAPSGTALLLAEAAAKGRNIDLTSHSDRGRDGITGARKPGNIGFSVVRSGGIIGDHDVSFGNESESLTLSHRALDRSLFATGAVSAAKWLTAQIPGFYTMQDMLDL